MAPGPPPLGVVLGVALVLGAALAVALGAAACHVHADKLMADAYLLLQYSCAATVRADPGTLQMSIFSAVKLPQALHQLSQVFRFSDFRLQ